MMSLVLSDDSFTLLERSAPVPGAISVITLPPQDHSVEPTNERYAFARKSSKQSAR
jgi:hypothetical protein